MEDKELCDCKKQWRTVFDGSFSECKIHNYTFKTGNKCKFYTPPMISDGNQSDKDNHSKSKFTQVVVKSHRSVVKSQQVVVDFTQVVVKLRDSGLSQRKIAKQLGVSQQYISKVLGFFKGREISERFHNFRVKFKAVTNFDAISLPEVKLNNNVCYKKIELDDFFVQVFRKSIIVVFKEHNNILGLDVVSAQAKAYMMIEDVISRLPKEIVLIDNVREVVGRHNAFVNHPGAKYDLKIYDDEGNLRIISDHSHGKLEKEAVSKDFCITDSQKIERHDKDVILQEGYTHGETKVKIDVLKSNMDVILGVQMEYAEQIKKHLEVQDKTLKSLEGIDKGIHRFSEVTEELTKSLKTKSLPDKEARLLRVKELKVEFGW